MYKNNSPDEQDNLPLNHQVNIDENKPFTKTRHNASSIIDFE